MLLAASKTTLDLILQALQSYAAAIAILAVFVAGAIYVLWRPRGVPRVLFGSQRWPAVPWMLPEVLLATAILMLLVPKVVAPLLHTKLEPGAYQGYQVSAACGAAYGPYDAGLSAGLTSFVGTLTAYPAEIARLITQRRSLELANVVLFPILVYFTLAMMRRLVGARPYQMGLHLNRWRENLTLGCVSWVVITPLVVLLYIFVRLEFWETLWGQPSEHPLSQLINLNPSLFTWIVATLAACVTAPFVEELLMRGIVQPYLIRWPIASDILVLFFLCMAVILLFNPGTVANQGQGMGPLLFVFTIAPGYFFFEKWAARWLPEPGVARGIFATSLLFAVIHGGAWPTPIPLFVFSVGVGVLAYRTGSLVGPITVHALFNATNIIVKYLEESAKS